MEGLAIVDACLRAVIVNEPDWWALENPAGYLQQWLGPPRLKFHPSDYGDRWTKRTWLWGHFREPKKNPVTAEKIWVSSSQSAAERSKTPPSFALAFCIANP